RRDPSVEVTIYPTAVQGDAAIPQIKSALRTAFQRNEVDVLLVTRGGGSLEDLWCFNDEQVGRLLLDAPMPVISAVGHEVDFTICDFIADLRAPTPSAAAEQVTQDRSAQVNRLQQLQQRLATGQKRRIERQHSLLQQLQIRLNQQHPQRQLQQQSQRLDELLARVYRAQQRTLVSQQQRRQHVIQRLQQVHPQRELSRAQQKLSQIQQRIPLVAEAWLKQQHQRQRALLHALNLVSPLNTLDRGYAIVRDEAGRVITQPEQTQAEQKLNVKVAGGEFNVRKCSE
ncbi:MAG: exodeoxyribonuclease VII large subunit, partial [Pseudomonadota bacterium]|nr:exodeoxyribonuclease VII large subunit [Pseudomonadota bacterium]